MKTVLKHKYFCIIFILGIWGCKSMDNAIAPPDQQGIKFIIKDKNTLKPIEGVKITITNVSSVDGVTDSNGIYIFKNLEAGKYSYTIVVDGYKSPTGLNGTVTVKTQLEEPILLEEEFPLIFDPIYLDFYSSNQLSKSINFKNKNTKREVMLSIIIPENDKTWLSVNKQELTIPTGEQRDLMFTIDPTGKTGKNLASKVILNYTTVSGRGSGNLNISMFIPDPQAPKVVTNEPSGITQNSADIIGTVTNVGGAFITQTGVCWSEEPNPNPEKDSKKVNAGGKLGDFSATIENLTSGKTYYVRAFAINSFGTGLGDVKKLTTSIVPTKPTLLVDIKNLLPNGLSLVGKITNTGGGKITEFGFCWSTQGDPTIKDNKLQVTKADANNLFSDDIIGLKPETDYKVRAYAISDIGGDAVGYSQVALARTLPADLSPKISNIVPLSGGFGDELVITGSNFGLDSSRIRVIFSNTKRAVLKSISETRLTVLVPEGAVTGTIRVQLTGQTTAESGQTFAYIPTLYVSDIVALSTQFYINDVTSACNGNIYFSAVNINANAPQPFPILGNGVFRLNTNNKVDELFLKNETGNIEGSLTNARLVNPTEITCFNGEVYVADQYDVGRYKSNASSAYRSIKKITTDKITTLFTSPLTTNFIHEILSFTPQNGILFTDGSFNKIDFSDPNSPKEVLSYDGLTTAMDYDGKDLYTLDLFPENNPTKWTLNRRNASVLSSTSEISSQPLITANVYPIGMAIDSKRGIAYIVELNKNNNFIIHQIVLATKQRDIVYDGTKSATQNEGKVQKGKIDAVFSSISCITYDATRDAVIFVDVDGRSRNIVRQMKYR